MDYPGISLRHSTACLLITTLFFLASYYLAIHIYMYWDVCWHIVGGNRIIHGGHYLVNLFDDNPPMVFFTYSPLAILESLVGYSSFYLAYGYILVLYALSAFVTYKVCYRVFGHSVACYSYFFSSLVCLLIVGVVILGQRECLLLYFITPYVLLNIFEYQPSKRLGIVAGLMAAIGIAQVPFYVVLLLMLDGLQCLVRRQWPQCLQWNFYIFFAIFIVAFYFVYPDYYHVIIKLYVQAQQGLDSSIRSIAANIFAQAVFYGLVFSVVAALMWRHNLRLWKLVLALLLVIVIYVLESKVWFYHLFPAIYFIYLIYAFLLTEWWQARATLTLVKKTLMMLFSLLILYSLALVFMGYRYQAKFYANKTTPLYRLIEFARHTNPHDNKTLFFYTRLTPPYVMQMYSGIDIVSPWSNNWLLPQLVSRGEPVEGKRILLGLVATTLEQQQPRYIIYPKADYLPYIKQKDFNYLSYFAQDNAIAAQLKYYHQYRKIGHFFIDLSF